MTYDPVTEIIATVGVSEALYLTFTAILDPGDEVIIPTPCFVSYQAEVILAGGVPVEMPGAAGKSVHGGPGGHPQGHHLATPSASLSVIPPTPPARSPRARSCWRSPSIAEEYNLLVVSDEIYDRLVYDFEHVCFPALGESLKRRTILLGGFSKDYAMTGWRIGYACGPADIIQGLVRIHQYTIMSAPTTAQDAAIEALKSGEPLRGGDGGRVRPPPQTAGGGLNRLGLKTFEPRGAFYAFPNITASGMDDETFAEKLLREEGVAVVPGNAFGPGGEGFVRACYATAYEKIEEALRRMERFMTRHG